MARASTVYAVMRTESEARIVPVVGFTVKKELVKWLKKQAPEDLLWTYIFKFPDGVTTYHNGDGPTMLYPEDFI